MRSSSLKDAGGRSRCGRPSMGTTESDALLFLGTFFHLFNGCAAAYFGDQDGKFDRSDSGLLGVELQGFQLFR